VRLKEFTFAASNLNFMTKFFLASTLVFLFLAATSTAQNRASIKGILFDSLDKSRLEYGTVAITEPKDSTLISYTLSSKEGNFSLKNLPAEQMLKLVISYVGYQTYRKTILLHKGETMDLGGIYLSRKTLKEVVIKGERQAITIKKDTIEFAPEAFKTRPNAVLEDLLKKLPGLQVDIDGSISVNGKKVTKITVDGKDFFASDLTIASKNINVDLIDKIQVVDDRDDDPDRLKDASQVDKVINLKLKKAIKKSVFGKLYAGGGSHGGASSERFESGGLLNMFKDTLQVSLIGFGNNVNRSAFSNTELNDLGGFNRSGTNSNSSGINFGGRSYGLQQIGSAGININYDIPKKLKLNLMYFYGNTKSEYGGTEDQQKYVGDTTFAMIGEYTNTNTANKHNISALADWKIDTVSNIRFQPRLGLSNSSNGSILNNSTSNDFRGKVNINENGVRSNDESLQYEHKLSYYRRFKKKDHSLNISNSIKFTPRQIERFTDGKIKYVLTQRDSALNQRINREDGYNAARIDVNYRYPLAKKLVSDWSVSSLYEGFSRSIATNKYNAGSLNYELVNNQSTDLGRNQWTYNFRSGITWNISKKNTLRAAAVVQYVQVMNKFKSIDYSFGRNYFNIFPSARFSAGQFSVSYDANLRQPGITDVQPITLNESQTYTYRGNINLTPVTNHSFNISYSKSVPASQISYSINSNINYEQNSIVWINNVKEDGVLLDEPINVNNTYYSWSDATFMKGFKKINGWQFKMTSGINAYTNKRTFFQNGIQDQQYNYELNPRAGFIINYKDVINYEPTYGLGKIFNLYAVNKLNNRDYFRQAVDNNLALHLKKRITLELNHSFRFNSQIARGFSKSNNLLNASASIQMFKKDRGQLKLTGFDLLDQNRGIYSYIGDNNYVTGTQLVLHRYLMLSYTYKFNSTITK